MLSPFFALIVVRMPSRFRTQKAQRPCLSLNDINYYLSNFISPPAKSLWRPFKCLYSENARDCVTGLHDRRSRGCNPVTPVECVSLSFRTRPCVLAFITHILCIIGIEITFAWLIWYTLRYICFEFAICFIALINFGAACHLKRRDLVTVWWTRLLLCCYHCECMQQHYDVTQFECVLRHHTMHECVMNIHHQTGIAQGRFTNIILTPSKQWGLCDNIYTWLYSYLSNHLSLHKMAFISQTIVSNAFSWTKSFVFWLRFTEVCS